VVPASRRPGEILNLSGSNPAASCFAAAVYRAGIEREDLHVIAHPLAENADMRAVAGMID
jgi:hypothetical protein